MFNNPRAKLQHTKVTFEDYRYQLYTNGKKQERVPVPYPAWRKYYKAEKKFDLLRMRIEAIAAKGSTPGIKLLIKYYDAVKDYMTAKIELEIYYYGAKDPQPEHDIQDDDEARAEGLPDL